MNGTSIAERRRQEDVMYEPVRRILVGVDESELGGRALHAALAMANAAGSTEIHAIHVRPGIDGARTMRGVKGVEADVDTLRERVEGELARYAEAHGQPEIRKISVHVRVGIPAEQIVSVAAELQAGLIVVGTHGRRGVTRAMMGSVAEAVVRTAGCPVLVMRPLHHPTLEDAVGDEVEPECDECAAARADSKGERTRCIRHARPRARAHVYHYEGPSTQSARPWGFS
jgi:nucleotide-binding universal stress UspA family protein